MRVESVLTGRHNQVVISAHLHERHDSNVDITGDVERKFIAGSVAKLYLASAAFAISQEGGFNLEERKHITLSDFAKGNYGTGELRFTNFPLALGLRLLRAAKEQPVTFRPVSNRRLLELMVSKSDNLATLVVVNTLGRELVQQVLTFWGMKETSLYNPQTGSKNQTTAEDVGRFLRKLSSGSLIPQNEAEVIKKWMTSKFKKNAELQPITLRYKDGRISEDGRSFYHKVGFIEGTLGEDIFVILTEGIAAERGRIPFSQEMKVQEIQELIIRRTP